MYFRSRKDFHQNWCLKFVEVEGSLVLLDLLLLSADGPVVLGEVLCELLVRRLGEEGLLPQIRGQVGVRLGDGGVGSLGCEREPRI